MRSIGGVAVIDAACERLSCRHHGVITREQARELGMSRAQIRYRVRQRRWFELFPGVFFIGGTRPTWESRLAAAVASAGDRAAASGRGAGAHYALDGCRKGPVEVISESLIARAPFRCHHTNFLPPHHVRMKDGIRTTSVARTIFDLGGLVTGSILQRAGTDALRRKLTSLGEIRAVLNELAASGRNGTCATRDFLEHYDPRLSLTANEFEAALFRILMKTGLPLPIPQQPVFDERGRIVRVDFLYPALRIVIEADGFTFHNDPWAVSRDQDRRNRLTTDGWLVLVFTWDMVTFRPDELVKQIAKAVRARS